MQAAKVQRVGSIIAVVAALGIAASGQSPGQNSTSIARGIALTPANFPRHSAADVDDMFKLAKELEAPNVVFIYQWSQDDLLQVAKRMVEESRTAGLTPIIGLSPTTLSGMRGALDAPASVRRAAGRNLSFKEKVVYEPYIRNIVELAKLKPPYLCLATEINLLALSNLNEYLAVAHIFKEVHDVVKKTSPSTKVFVSFQWDVIHMMAVKEPNRIQEHAKQIEIFRPELDVVAFTSYPADHFDSPAKIPDDYYARIRDYVRAGEEVMFMEIGWPTTGKGSEQEQVEFIRRLPSLMSKVKPSIVAWSLLHDVRGSGLEGDLASTGLAEPAGRRKPGFEAFRQLE